MASMCGAIREGVGVDGSGMHLLAEVVDTQHARVAGGPMGREHVAGSGEVVARCGRRGVAHEDGAGVTNVDEDGVGVGDHQLEVLGSDLVGDGRRLGGSVADDAVAAGGHRRPDVVRARRLGDDLVQGLIDPIGHLGMPVTSQARPSGPCSAWTIRSIATSRASAAPSATTTTSMPAKADGTPTWPLTSCLAMATYRLPGPTMTSTGSTDSVP